LSSLIPSRKSINTDSDGSPAIPREIAAGSEEVVQIPVGAITPNPHQPRHMFEPEGLKDLVDSIREHGIIQPLIVTALGDGKWQLIAGERRWRSAKEVGLKTVPVIVRDLTEQKKLEIAIIENIQRKDLNGLEVARAYQKLIDEFSLTQEALGKRLGKSRSAITNTLRLLTAPEPVMMAIERGEISEGHARVLVGLPIEDQLALLEKIKSIGMSVRDTERAGRDVVVQKHIRKVAIDPELRAYEEEIASVLGTKVEIKKNDRGGQIMIRYFSPDELRGIVNKINP
jgi:ParB family chromosome partitioning protein